MGIVRILVFLGLNAIWYFIGWWPLILAFVVYLVVDHYRDKKAYKRIEQETDEILARNDFSTEKGHVADSCAETRSLLSRAERLHREGRFADMEVPLRRILEIQPDHAEALAALGNVLVTIGNPKEAIVHLERSAAITKGQRGWALSRLYVMAMTGLADALYALERYDDENDAYRTVVEFLERQEDEEERNHWLMDVGTCYASALLRKPILHRRNGDFETATRLLRRVIEIDARPESNLLVPRLLLAQALSEQGDRKGGIASLRDALFVARRFRSLDEGSALPVIHARLAEFFDEEVKHEGLFWLRQEARLRSVFHRWQAGREAKDQESQSTEP